MIPSALISTAVRALPPILSDYLLEGLGNYCLTH